ncbi:hypothetical protein [Faecalicoccus pleomorphus]|uniref:hypothetical protein n=1 Tax=Faecalicoccus pleomorphus TaxID=1323 RepID=UPI0019601F72|nr:hypothetical protein [Faecalicoccus pleomorphus]MBM6808638.1 hypothetical protein [Faecalicoccus pleomorphus]
MKKFLSCLSLCCLVLLSGCSSPEAFQEVEIDAKELQEKLDDKEDFVVIVEREGCSYCEALDAYIEETKQEHAGLVLYKLDSTDFDLKREKEEDMTLVTTNEDGQILLKMAPYFLYTPSLYIVEDGKAIQAGIGYNDLTHEVSLWDVDSTIDFDKAEPLSFWTFVESGQAK